MSTVEVDGAGRSFGSQPAVVDLTFQAPAGAITAMLGPNGAGKTTALRLITGALLPDRGQIRVFDLDPGSSQGESVRRRCGVVTAKPSLYDRLSGLDNLRYSAELFGLGRGSAVDRQLRAAAEQFGIDAALTQPVGGYSTGMKTRLALARAVVHEPELLLLDEPTSGLDPESSATVLELVRAMSDDGRTVILCTHLLAEADGLADQVVVLEQGTAVAAGDPAQLAAGFWPKPLVRFEAEHGPDLDRLATQPGVVTYRRDANRALLSLDQEGLVSDLILTLGRDGIRLLAVEPIRPTLEDLYFAIQARSRGQEPVTAGPSMPLAPSTAPLVAAAGSPSPGAVPSPLPVAASPSPPGSARQAADAEVRS